MPNQTRLSGKAQASPAAQHEVLDNQEERPQPPPSDEEEDIFFEEELHNQVPGPNSVKPDEEFKGPEEELSLAEMTSGEFL